MELPEPVQPMPIANTSPTLATVMSKCFLRAAFANSEHSAYTFPWPKAMLGSAAHQVLERVYKGEMTAGNEAEAITQIRELWEDAVEEQRGRVSDNPVQQAFLNRFGEPQKWPGYSLRRARTVRRGLCAGVWIVSLRKTTLADNILIISYPIMN